MADIEKIQPMGDSTQYTLRARTDSDGNVIVNKYVTLDTSQTISGGKAFTSSVTIRNNGRWPYLEYKPITSSTTTCMVIWGGTDESGNITDSTLEFRLMSPSSTLNTNIGDHFEGYKLPSVNKDRTTDIWYNILTEKNYNDYTPTKTGGGASGTWGINITGNAATATKLSNTPNRTDYFLRGDNNWSNAVTGYINSYGLWADQNWNDGNEHQIGVQGNAGKIYMYSSGTTNSNRGIYSCNASGTYQNVLAITPSNDLYLYPHVIQMSDRGVIYSDNYSTGYGGLCLSGGTGYLSGASIALHSCDTNSDQGPGCFYISARPTADTWDGQKVLEGRANGLLTWNGGLSVNGGPNPGVGTATGHTISTNGNIGCDYECYSNGGFYAGGRSSIYRLWNNGWYDALGSYQNGDTFLRACGGRMHIGFDATNDILVSTTSGWLCGFWQNGTTMISRVAGEGLDQGGPALCIREVGECGTSQDHPSYAPRIAFHWSGRVGQNIGPEADGVFRFRWHSSNYGLSTIQAGAVWGAVYNDYAEMRNIPEVQKNMPDKKPLENYEKPKREIPMAGRCVHEVGDDTMELTTERMQLGCRIISDTFGFNIGETKDAKIPVAVSGRVLAYPYESREIYRKNIGRPVCSGPNGTISIMTDEEYRDKGYCCLGIISAVPDYERWGEDNVLVDGRIWIYVR